MAKQLKVTITDKHIERSKQLRQEDPENFVARCFCPTALALKEQFPEENIEVGTWETTVAATVWENSVSLNQKVIRRFDDHKPPKAGTYILKEWE